MPVFRSARDIRRAQAAAVPLWELWVETAAGGKSIIYKQPLPLPSVGEMDAAILGVMKSDGASQGAILYQRHITSGRLFMHQYKARGKDSLYEQVNNKWVRRD
jgi:hypothetical protein